MYLSIKPRAQVEGVDRLAERAEETEALAETESDTLGDAEKEARTEIVADGNARETEGLLPPPTPVQSRSTTLRVAA